MKRIIVMTMLMLLAIMSNAQSEGVKMRFDEVNKSTSEYVKQYILSRSYLYIGKPLQCLIDDLPVPITHYLVGLSSRVGEYNTLFITLNQHGLNGDTGKKRGTMRMVIGFTKSGLKPETACKSSLKLRGAWGNEIACLFKDRVIESISGEGE